MDAATGTTRWRTNVGVRLTGAPTLAGDVLYAVTDDGKVVAVDAATGTLQWRLDAGSAPIGPPTVAGGRIYVGGTDGAVIAIGGIPTWIMHPRQMIDAFWRAIEVVRVADPAATPAPETPSS